MLKLSPKVNSFIKTNGPTILVAAGTAGLIGAGVEAVRRTPAALRHLELKKRELQKEKLTFFEKVDATWKDYIIPVAMGALSTFSIFSGFRMTSLKLSALMASTTALESSSRLFKEVVQETVPEDTFHEIEQKVAQRVVDENPLDNGIIAERGNGGNELCYDVMTGRYFYSDKESIRSAINDFNSSMIAYTYASLNELLGYFGISDIGIGEYLGWNINRGQIEARFDGALAPNGKPCLVLDYGRPYPDYTKA